MKKIIIKCCKYSGLLRTEAMAKAIEFEEIFMKDRKEGWRNGVLWVKESNNGIREWQMYAYHTKTAIIVDVRMSSKNSR